MILPHRLRVLFAVAIGFIQSYSHGFRAFKDGLRLFLSEQ